MHYKKFALGLYLILQFITITSKARWACYEDAEEETEFLNEEIIVNEDGTFTCITEIQQKILKESAKNSLANYILSYNEHSSEIKISEAKTINIAYAM